MQSIGCSQTLSSWPVIPLIKMPSGIVDMDGVKAELQRLQPEGNVYAVLGNHDPDSSHKEVKEYFEEAGIHLLIDECAETEDFLIVGRDDILGNPAPQGHF